MLSLKKPGLALKEKEDRTALTGPTSGSVSVCRRALRREWCMNITPSMSRTPWEEQTSIISRVCSIVTATGLSTSTCFFAAAALLTHSRCRVVGRGDVDRLDVGVVDDQLVGVVELARGGESAVPGEVPGLLDVSRGQGHQLAAPGERDRPGVLPGDAGPPAAAEPHRSHVRRHAGRLLEHFKSLLNKTVARQSLPRIRISSILSNLSKRMSIIDFGGRHTSIEINRMVKSVIIF